jgi:putative DNA methylase
MFSNHILKPERTPLENSVWGTDKSSGTFSALFESRLLRAKHYLDEPFELEFKRDLFGKAQGTRKTLASLPLDVAQVSAWGDLLAHDRAVMVLNGDSARLPVPDASVDAVVTDPPYFDFVHYSELSDFFFAWLSPALASRYPWMKRPDSSDKGEVQHKNPHVFANQLSRVFTECCRVLKDDGVLAFSFHHSRAEGWAAIYEAVASAGFEVVAAHPVHAELRGASPKNAAKNPISIDAILVCKKRFTNRQGLGGNTAVNNAEQLVNQLESNGYRVSLADRFVVLASQMLIPLSRQRLDFESVCNEIQRAAQQLVPA